ncbi:hypothetical protein ACUM5Y_15505 [Marinomonas dokdonensis]|uniref:hypothetical protein n=1 Tax=Marinomonas dokdonensis TaxID=328224 RepID=UPI0040553EBD
MKNNLIPFPKIKKPQAGDQTLTTSGDELVALRDQFDRARENWPVEIAELPENNKLFSSTKK